MAAPRLPSASTTRKAWMNTPDQSPQSTETNVRNACPPPLQSPPRTTPRIVPGPNAFAAKLRAEAITTTESQPKPHHQTSNGSESYSVSMYKGMQPSPKLHGGPFETTKSESPKSSGSYNGLNEAPNSPTGNTFWQQSEPISEFALRLQNERARLHGNATKRVSPSEREAEKLKLIPSRGTNYQQIPSHRMELDLRREQRQVQGIQAPPSSLPFAALKAPVHTPRNRSRTPTPLQLEHSNIKSTSGSSSSPRKKFFNIIGLGGPTLKPTTPQNASPLPDPTKPDLTPLKNVPPKAARVLGTASLGNRVENAPSCNKQSPRSLDDGAGECLHEIHRSSSNGHHEQHPKTTSTDSSRSRSRYTKYGGEYKDIDDGVGMHLRLGNLRDDSDERPPTPPSKSTLRERYGEQAKCDPGSAGLSAASEQVLNHSLLRNSANAVDEGLPHIRRTGYVSRPHVVDAGTPIRRSIESGRNETKQLPPFPGTISPRPALRSSRGTKRMSLRATFEEGDTLPTTVYTPSNYGDGSSAAQPSPYSALSVSPGQLRPVPLNVPPHIRQEQRPSSPSSGSDNKSRDTSNSTSASVPVYLETPSTANLRSARSGGMPTASSTSDHPNESAVPHSSPGAGSRKAPARDDHPATAAGLPVTPRYATKKAQVRGISPTSSRPRPSYESMTTDHESCTAGHDMAQDGLGERINDAGNNRPGHEELQDEGNTSPRDEIGTLLDTILHDRIAGLEGVQATLRILCEQIEALSTDVRAVLSAVHASSGIGIQRQGTAYATRSADHAKDAGSAGGGTGADHWRQAAHGRNDSNGDDGAVPRDAMGYRITAGEAGMGKDAVDSGGGTGSATWGPGGIYAGRDGSRSREVLRSLPAGLERSQQGH